MHSFSPMAEGTLLVRQQSRLPAHASSLDPQSSYPLPRSLRRPSAQSAGQKPGPRLREGARSTETLMLVELGEDLWLVLRLC